MKCAISLIALLTIVACGLDVKNAATKNNSGPVLGPPVVQTAGELLYDAKCGTCHALGPDTSLSGGAVNLKGTTKLQTQGYFPTAGAVGHQGITLSAAEITTLKDYIASIK